MHKVTYHFMSLLNGLSLQVQGTSILPLYLYNYTAFIYIKNKMAINGVHEITSLYMDWVYVCFKIHVIAC